MRVHGSGLLQMKRILAASIVELSGSFNCKAAPGRDQKRAGFAALGRTVDAASLSAALDSPLSNRQTSLVSLDSMV